MQDAYTSRWFERKSDLSERSAQMLVPLLIELTGAESVVDVGCGAGVWLSQFVERGISDVLGVDGGQVNVAELRIASNRFMSHDLNEPLYLDRGFDLALCLEVAEYLPAACADHLVATLTTASPIVFFSAAIPSQGTMRHANEQWPEYWIGRFESRGFQFIDALRPRIWNNSSVDFGYAQNGVLFAHESLIAVHARLRDEWRRSSRQQVAMVHPQLYLRTAQTLEQTIDYRVRNAFRRARQVARRVLSV